MTRRWGTRPMATALAAMGVAAVAAGCSSTPPPKPSSTTTTTVPKSTTTTTGLPTALQTNPQAAAAAMVAAWAGGNRASALTVGTPAAVGQLFAIPYPGAGLAISRGCSTAFIPIVCTYGPPGGAPPTDPIYEIDVSQSGVGWYVSAVKVN